MACRPCHDPGMSSAVLTHAAADWLLRRGLQIPRVPIICTGNDFSTLYAPLIRDGRMEKYYWNPTREDRIGAPNPKASDLSAHWLNL